MSGLADLHLKTEYRKGHDDIADAFYIPCMKLANSFDRAVGFFSSTIYILAWEALNDFVSNSGKIRIICSPVLSAEDISAISEGYSNRLENKITQNLNLEINSMINDKFRRKPAIVLATLVSMNIIDVRIAIMTGQTPSQGRLFHDKLGIFYDGYGNTVAFKGSMNETWSGLSSDGNLESVDVFVNWVDDRDRERIGNSIRDFNLLWNDKFPTVSVQPFPEAAKKNLLKIADSEKWVGLVDEIIDENKAAKRITADKKPGGRIPRPHQTDALEKWKVQGRRGILEHATGSGKTFTALCAIRESINQGETIIILVPSELLLKQWETEVKETLMDIQPSVLLCGAGNIAWKEPGLLAAFTRNRGQASPRIVLSTMQTASTDEFIRRIDQGAHIFLVSDEVHRIGSRENKKIMTLNTGPRLGLSATPQRAGDPEGTSSILAYFGNVVPPPFTLKDAIDAKTLTPYFYFSHPILLNNSEQREWDIITDKIQVYYARHQKNSDEAFKDYIRNMLIQRSRIVKSASGKVPLAVKVVTENISLGDRWIVYCDSQDQLGQILHALRGAGIDALEYHSAMVGDRDRTLSHFMHNGGVVVSIRCLDEGVDIPSVTHALILASSKNPREFIQRRGRVLRIFPGKTLAFLHDAIVVPSSPEKDGPGSTILFGEISRALEFSKGALNPSSAQDLELIALRSGFDYTLLTKEGYEDEEEE